MATTKPITIEDAFDMKCEYYLKRQKLDKRYEPYLKHKEANEYMSTHRDEFISGKRTKKGTLYNKIRGWDTYATESVDVVDAD